MMQPGRRKERDRDPGESGQYARPGRRGLRMQEKPGQAPAAEAEAEQGEDAMFLAARRGGESRRGDDEVERRQRAGEDGDVAHVSCFRGGAEVDAGRAAPGELELALKPPCWA